MIPRMHWCAIACLGMGSIKHLGYIEEFCRIFGVFCDISAWWADSGGWCVGGSRKESCRFFYFWHCII